MRRNWLFLAAVVISGGIVDAQVTSCGGDLSNGGNIAYTTPGNHDHCIWTVQCFGDDVATITFNSFSTDSGYGVLLSRSICLSFTLLEVTPL